MLSLHPKYITDPSGKKQVLLSEREFAQILAELEELEDVKLYDKAKEANEPSVPIEKAFKQIELKRKRKK